MEPLDQPRAFHLLGPAWPYERQGVEEMWLSYPHGASQFFGEVNLPFREQLPTMQDGANRGQRKGAKDRSSRSLFFGSEMHDVFLHTLLRSSRQWYCPFRHCSSRSEGLGCLWTGRGAQSSGCHGNRHSAAKMAAIPKVGF